MESTQAVLSTEQAAARYLAIVEPYNRALERLEQAVNAGQPLSTLNALAAETATANERHLRELESTRWPPEVDAAVARLVDDSKQAQRYWHRAQRADTRQQLIDAVISAAEHDGGQAAATIRELLGLDDYDEGTYGG